MKKKQPPLSVPDTPTKQKKPRKLTVRESRLVTEMANPKTKSARQAALNAGYAETTASVDVYKILEKPSISEAISRRINAALLHSRTSPEEVLGGAVRQMRSSMDDVLDEQGSFSLEKARETGAVDFLKKHKETIKTVTTDNGSYETRTIEIEMMTNQDGRKEVANVLGLVKNPVEPPAPPSSDEEIARELYNRLRDRRQLPHELAAEAVAMRFPNLNIKFLPSNAT